MLNVITRSRQVDDGYHGSQLKITSCRPVRFRLFRCHTIQPIAHPNTELLLQTTA